MPLFWNTLSCWMIGASRNIIYDTGPRESVILRFSLPFPLDAGLVFGRPAGEDRRRTQPHILDNKNRQQRQTWKALAYYAKFHDTEELVEYLVIVTLDLDL